MKVQFGGSGRIAFVDEEVDRGGGLVEDAPAGAEEDDFSFLQGQWCRVKNNVGRDPIVQNKDSDDDFSSLLAKRLASLFL